MPKTENVVRKNSLLVAVGTKVLIEVNGEPQSWEIVEVGKSDIPKGKISYAAPLSQCILGSKEGDVIKCKIMDDNVTIVIEKISLITKC